MIKASKLILIVFVLFMLFSCSSDDSNDCPETMVIDINDPESVARAEACGLSPAEPLGSLWVSDKLKN